MLAQPFLCALILAREWSWFAIPAAIAAAAVFLARIPLVTIARQRFVWTQPRPETAVAKTWILGLAAVLAACALALALRWPLELLAAFGLAASALTGFAVWMTVRNRQRSVGLQLLSALGLAGSSAAACLSVKGALPEWCWWLWGLSAAHSAAGILVVHARLDARVAARKQSRDPNPWRRPALTAQILLIALVPLAASRSGWLGLALAISAAAHLWDLARLNAPESIATPLKKVGLRALALSTLFSALLIRGLW